MASTKRVKHDLDEDDAPAAAEGGDDGLIEGIILLQSELEKLNDEASDKVLEVEAHYNKLRKPVYSRRAEAIARVPDFWFQCFVQHPLLSQSMTEEDSEILSFLRQVYVEDFKDLKSGYKIIFVFDENPYFSDKELSKSFAYDTLDDGMMVCSGEAIHWYPGKDPTQKAEAETLKGGKRARSLEESFFLWFPEPDLPYETATDPIADVIKDQLWINPVKYFCGDIDQDWEAPHNEEDDDEPPPHVWANHVNYDEEQDGEQGEYEDEDAEGAEGYEDEDGQPQEEYDEEADPQQEEYEEEEGGLQGEEEYEEEYDEEAGDAGAQPEEYEEEGEPPDPEGEQGEEAYEEDEDAEDPQGE